MLGWLNQVAKASGKTKWLKLAALLIQQQFKFGNELLYSPIQVFFLYIFPYIGIFCLYNTLFFFYILPRLQCFDYIYNRDTDYWCFLIYIQKKPSFFFFILPQKCVFSIYSVFPIVKITLFCLYISFLLYFAQIVVYVFLIYIGNITISFPRAILFAL